jgi:NDP-sugar pyrophosphorylase family protein
MCIVHMAQAMLAVRVHEWQNPFGVIRTESIKNVGFDEKPIHRTHANAGIYLLAPAVLDEWVVGIQCVMPTLIERADDLQLASNKYTVDK